MKVKLSEIIDAIEMMDVYSEYFIDKETGEIECVNDMTMSSSEKDEVYDSLDEHGFYRLPTSFDIRDYDIMEAFVNTLSGIEYEKLAHAIQGKGAFRRFKDNVYDLGIDQQWYDYQAKEYRRIAAEWCEENSIEYEE